jgi:hypothetical protein
MKTEKLSNVMFAKAMKINCSLDGSILFGLWQDARVCDDVQPSPWTSQFVTVYKLYISVCDTPQHLNSLMDSE